jgi:hypothetical protein
VRHHPPRLAINSVRAFRSMIRSILSPSLKDKRLFRIAQRQHSLLKHAFDDCRRSRQRTTSIILHSSEDWIWSRASSAPCRRTFDNSPCSINRNAGIPPLQPRKVELIETDVWTIDWRKNWIPSSIRTHTHRTSPSAIRANDKRRVDLRLFGTGGRMLGSITAPHEDHQDRRRDHRPHRIDRGKSPFARE